MASIEKRPDGKYRARWREFPRGPQKSKHFARKRDAEAFLDQLRVQLSTGTYVDPSAGSELFSTYAKRWQTNQVNRPRTADKIDTILRVHLLPAFGDRQLRSIRRSDVQSFVKGLEMAGRAPSYVAVIYTYLSMILKDATADQVITRSPCVKIALPPIEPKRVEVMPMKAVHALADSMPDRIRAMVWVAIGSGLRLSEILGLTVDRVDFLRRSITVDRQMTVAKGHGPQLGPPKSKASHRTIPVASDTIEAISAHLSKWGEGDGRLIFATPTGGAWRLNTVEDLIRIARQAAGVDQTFHTLRHTYASILIDGGASAKVVQERLGHKSVAMTLDVYSHLWPADDEKTRDIIEAALRMTPM